MCVCVYRPSQVLCLSFRWPIGWQIECLDLLMYPCSLGSCVGLCCLSVFLTTVCYFSTKQCVIWWKHSGVCSTSWLAQLTVPRFYVLYLWRLQQDMWNSFFFLWDLTKFGRLDFVLLLRVQASTWNASCHVKRAASCVSDVHKIWKGYVKVPALGSMGHIVSRLKNNLTTGVVILRRLRLVPIGHTWPTFSSRLWALQTSWE